MNFQAHILIHIAHVSFHTLISISLRCAHGPREGDVAFVRNLISQHKQDLRQLRPL